MYTIFLTGEDPHVPSTDTDDARVAAREIALDLQQMGHRIGVVLVNGHPVDVPSGPPLPSK